MAFWASLCILVASLAAGYGFQITEQSSARLVRPGENLDLPCTVTGNDFEPDSMSLSWRKTQEIDGTMETEDYVISQYIQMQAPFDNVTQYDSVNLNKDNPTTYRTYTLRLRNVREEESGKYICRVEGNNQQVDVVYTVSVYDGPDSMIIYSRPAQDVGQDITTWGMDSWTSTSRLEFADNTAGFFACLVRGVYPEPVIRVYANDQLISGFATRSPMELVGDTDGMKRYMSDSVLYTHSFPVDAANDQATLVCEAKVMREDGTEVETPLRQTATLVLQKRPEFVNCSSEWRTPVDTENFQLHCLVLSALQPTRVEFRAESTGDRMSLGDRGRDEFVVSMQISGDSMWRVMLTISRVTVDYFQGYTVTVENDYGSESKTLTVIIGEAEVGAATSWAASTPLLLVLLLLTLCLS